MKIRELETDASGVLLPFETKKGKYYVIKPGDPLGIQRFTEREKLAIVLGAGKTFAALQDTLKNVENLLGSDKPFSEIRTEAILAINGLRRGVVEMSKERYHYGLYLATIFIYREDHDPLKWDMNTATEMIEDWAAEGLSEHGFFSFALGTIAQFKTHYENIQNQVRESEGVLSGISSFLTTDGAK